MGFNTTAVEEMCLELQGRLDTRECLHNFNTGALDAIRGQQNAQMFVLERGNDSGLGGPKKAPLSSPNDCKTVKITANAPLCKDYSAVTTTTDGTAANDVCTDPTGSPADRRKQYNVEIDRNSVVNGVIDEDDFDCICREPSAVFDQEIVEAAQKIKWAVNEALTNWLFTQMGTYDKAGTDASTGGTAASTILTAGGNATDGGSITIGSKTYTFQATLTDVDGNIHIGASASDTLDNLIAAINASGGTPGTDYAASNTIHPTVSAAAGAGDTVNLTAKSAGTLGNSLASTSTDGNLSFSGATFAGGTSNTDILPLYSTEGKVQLEAFTQMRHIYRKLGITCPIIQIGGLQAQRFLDTYEMQSLNPQNNGVKSISGINVVYDEDFDDNMNALQYSSGKSYCATLPVGSIGFVSYNKYLGYKRKSFEDMLKSTIVIDGLEYDFCWYYEKCESRWKWQLELNYEFLSYPTNLLCNTATPNLLWELGCADLNCDFFAL